MATATSSCANCQKTPPSVTLKNCAKCKSTSYCSRDCQKAHWKSHKPTCGKQQPSPFSSSLSPGALTQPLTAPFTRLQNNTYLTTLPEIDVYTLLIDAYRLRVTDTANFDGPAVVQSEIFMNDDNSGLRGLQHFLDRAQTGGSGALPGWWNESKRAACEELAQGGGELGTPALRAWLDVGRRATLDKAAVAERYGNPQFPMQLRMLAERVYGRGVGGMSGAGMLGMMAGMEGGGLGDGMTASMLDVSGGMRRGA